MTPITCTGCGSLVGVAFADALELFETHCDGNGRHPEPVWTETLSPRGMVRTVELFYPVTRTRSVRKEYAGPRNRALLALVRFFCSGRGGISVP